MATSQPEQVIRQLRRTLLLREEGKRSDGDLLLAFIQQQDPVAFEILVRRHGRMVLSACRRILGHHQDAEDAYQATFLVLTRKASSIVPRDRVGGWLHGVACRVSLRLRTLASKQRWREKQVEHLPQQATVCQPVDRELLTLIDQELNRLPDRYRLPILLCELEGKSIREVARQLDWPQGTVAGRLARARKLLASRLTGRGVVLSEGILTTLLARAGLSVSVPAGLIKSVVQSALLVAAGQGAGFGGISATVAVLMNGVLTSMMLTKIKTVALIFLVVATATIGGGLAGSHAIGQGSAPPGKTDDFLARIESRAEKQPLPEERPGAIKELLGQDQPDKKYYYVITQGVRKGQVVTRIEFTDNETVHDLLSLLQGDSQMIPKNTKKRIWISRTMPNQTTPQILPVDWVGITKNGVTSTNYQIKPDDRIFIQSIVTDLDRMQGVWSVVSAERDGQAVPPEKTVLLIQGKRACWQSGISESQGGLYLDSTGKPKTYDFITSTSTQEGIYSLQGDTLSLCYDAKPDAGRPEQFQSEKGSGQVLIKLKRTAGPEAFPLPRDGGARTFPRMVEP